jgi:hypothetical protein
MKWAQSFLAKWMSGDFLRSLMALEHRQSDMLTDAEVRIDDVELSADQQWLAAEAMLRNCLFYYFERLVCVDSGTRQRLKEHHDDELHFTRNQNYHRLSTAMCEVFEASHDMVRRTGSAMGDIARWRELMRVWLAMKNRGATGAGPTLRELPVEVWRVMVEMTNQRCATGGVFYKWCTKPWAMRPHPQI